MAGGGSGKEPNLTPLIDLFSVLIVFLLISASLTHLEVFQAVINETPKKTPDLNDLNASDVEPEDESKPKKLRVLVYPDKIEVKIGDDSQVLSHDQFRVQDSNFEAIIPQLKNHLSEKNPIIIDPQEGSKYKSMIQVYDQLMLAGIKEIAISPF